MKAHPTWSFVRFLRFNKVLCLFFLNGLILSCGEVLKLKSQIKMIGIDAVERELRFVSYVYMPIDADILSIKTAIARQIQSATGALNQEKISLNNSDLLRKIKEEELVREIFTVVDPNEVNFAAKKIQKISYQYNDSVVVSSKLENVQNIQAVLLANDYTQYVDELIKLCSDGISADLETVWYYYRPQMSSCQERINHEIESIASAQRKIGEATKSISSNEMQRWFVPVKVDLGLVHKIERKIYPEYNRLLGVDDAKTKLIIYVFGGVDLDSSLPDDRFGLEHLRFLRKLLEYFPNLKIVGEPPTDKIQDIFKVLLDHKDYPQELTNDPAKLFQFLTHKMSQIAEKWIYWEQSAKLSSINLKGEKVSKEILIQIRTFYGNDESSPEVKEAAKARYLEAFRDGDVIIYNGHANFGKGIMNPLQYQKEDFNDRYQLILLNSCYSFSYYHQEFFNLKPGGKKNLNMIVNGLASQIKKSGEVNAAFLKELLSLEDYESILMEMRKASGFDALQVVDGESDNLFSPIQQPIEIKIL